MFIDTHAHMSLMVKNDENTPLTSEKLEQIKKIVIQASTANVEIIINISTTAIDSMNSITIARNCPNVFAVVGIHPCDSLSNWREQFVEIEKLVKDKNTNKIVGIGEIGFDFYHEPFNQKIQQESFQAQIELALKNDLPIVIHARNATDELLYILDQYKNDNLRGVIHCFSQTQEFAEQVLKYGFYIGIDGNVTYPKNNELRQIVQNIPLQNLLLETDAPFLPPQQFRGKLNHPSYIQLIADFIAKLKNTTPENIAIQTTENAKKLFHLAIFLGK